jgi:hypothetical protein
MAAQSKFLNPRLGKSAQYLMRRLLASILAICGLAELAHVAPLTPLVRFPVLSEEWYFSSDRPSRLRNPWLDDRRNKNETLLLLHPEPDSSNRIRSGNDVMLRFVGHLAVRPHNKTRHIPLAIVLLRFQEKIPPGITNAACSLLPRHHRFRSMWSTIPLNVGRDSGMWSTIPLNVGRDSGKNQNADRFPTESWTTSNRILDRFQWHHRTTSTGIRNLDQLIAVPRPAALAVRWRKSRREERPDRSRRRYACT